MPVILIPGPPGANAVAISPTIALPVYVPEIPGPVGGQGASGGGTVTAVSVPTAGPPGVPGQAPLVIAQVVPIPVMGYSMPGPVGQQGPIGLTGPAGQDAISARFIYQHSTPSTEWIIIHGMNTYPDVSVLDTGGNLIEGDVYYESLNEIILSFSAAFGGTAILT